MLRMGEVNKVDHQAMQHMLTSSAPVLDSCNIRAKPDLSNHKAHTEPNPTFDSTDN